MERRRKNTTPTLLNWESQGEGSFLAEDEHYRYGIACEKHAQWTALVVRRGQTTFPTEYEQANVKSHGAAQAFCEGWARASQSLLGKKE